MTCIKTGWLNISEVHTHNKVFFILIKRHVFCFGDEVLNLLDSHLSAVHIKSRINGESWLPH